MATASITQVGEPPQIGVTDSDWPLLHARLANGGQLVPAETVQR